MLRFLDGHLLGTTSHTGTDPNASGGGGGNGGAGANGFLATLPETVRGHDAFKDVKDVSDLATRYHKTVATPFAEQLPEDIRGDASFKDIKDLPSLAKSYLNAQKKIGVPADRLLTLPQDDKPESWNEIYTKLGRPESVDKYEIPKPGEGKDYTEGDRQFQQKMLPILHEAGVTQRQLAAIVPKFNALMGELSTAQQTAIQENVAKGDEALTKEWGAAKGENLSRAKKAMSFFAQPDSPLKLGKDLAAALELKAADGRALGDIPAVAELFAYLGKNMEEDGLIGKGGGGGDGALSPVEAEQQINALQGDKAFMAAYTSKKHPGHADAVARMSRLYEFKTAKPAE